MTKQSQKAGDNSTNIQTDNVIVHQGLSYSEVRDIARDVFKANFYELAGVARDIAGARAQEITEHFLEKLHQEDRNGFQQANDPDFQYALYTVQRAYARNGDEELGDLLVDLLVDRSKQGQRSIMQIVLNESMKTAPKLTNDQLAALSLIFTFRYSKNDALNNIETLGNYFDKQVLPFVGGVSKGNSCYQHLVFSGCGQMDAGKLNLGEILIKVYPGLFVNGFDSSYIADREVTIGLDSRFFIPCLNNQGKMQVNALTMEQLDKNFDVNSILQEDRSKIRDLFFYGMMSVNDVKDKCIAIRPYMENIFDVWDNSFMNRLSLTSVGIAIGHANIKRQGGEFADLSIWIN